MSGLLTPAEVAAELRVRDRRTVRRRLAELAIPVVPAGRSYRVRAVDLERGLAAAARLEDRCAAAAAAGVELPPGARLWDGVAPAAAAGVRSPSPTITRDPRRTNGS